jgi:hypothetical protein
MTRMLSALGTDPSCIPSAWTCKCILHWDFALAYVLALSLSKKAREMLKFCN